MTCELADPKTSPAGDAVAVVDRSAQSETERRPDHNPHPPPNPPLDTKPNGALQSLVDRVGELAERFRGLDQRQAAIHTNVQQLGTENRLLSDMHDQCRVLQERFHEREVLLPIFRALIGIADRSRNETAKLRATLNDQQRGLELDVVLALRHLVDAREADRIELDALLATFGVEFYRHEGDRFEASQQKCVKRVRTTTRERHERIAVRLLPGYRRDGTVIRPECVGVYVLTSQKLNQQRKAS